jgi:peptide-methionine (S)-S-oxide reductase
MATNDDGGAAVTGEPAGGAVAVLGGGCFWCLEAVFRRLSGVHSVVSGYCGGQLASPDYESVCAGTTGHAEVVRVVFDPSVISYETLLEVFFAIHDPTTRDRQGNDVGPQYRSVVFFQDEAQRAAAAAAIGRLAAAGVAAVTELVPAAPFWPAETCHQRYYDAHPVQPYCRAVIGPKLAKLGQRFASLLAGPQPR